MNLERKKLGAQPMWDMNPRPLASDETGQSIRQQCNSK